MKKYVTGALAALLLALGLVAVTVAPAAAAWNSCPTGQGAVFLNANGGDPHGCLPFSMYAPPGCFNFVAPWNESISSVRVTYGSGYGIRLFLNAFCDETGGEGTGYITVPHLKQTNLADDDRDCGPFHTCSWDNVVSSFRITPA